MPGKQSGGSQDRLRKYEQIMPKDQVVFTEGAPSDSLFVLLQGAVKVIRANKVLAEIRDPWSFIGEMGVLRDEPRSASIITLAECKFLVFPVNDLSFIFKNESLTQKFLKALADRVDSASAMATDFSTKLDETRRKFVELRDNTKKHDLDRERELTHLQMLSNGLYVLLNSMPKKVTHEQIKMIMRYMDRVGIYFRGVSPKVEKHLMEADLQRLYDSGRRK